MNILKRWDAHPVGRKPEVVQVAENSLRLPVSYVLPLFMPEARQYETQDGNCPFRRWFIGLEARAAARITRAVTKFEGGLRPNVKGVGEGVMEARIDYGPGYRVYFGLALQLPVPFQTPF